MIRLLCDCLPSTWLCNAAHNLATPTCPTKTPTPPYPKLYSTAPPIFVGFHNCGCQSHNLCDRGRLRKLEFRDQWYLLKPPSPPQVVWHSVRCRYFGPRQILPCAIDDANKQSAVHCLAQLSSIRGFLFDNQHVYIGRLCKRSSRRHWQMIQHPVSGLSRI